GKLRVLTLARAAADRRQRAALGRPGMRRSFTRTSPSRRAWRSALLTTVRQQPASAAIASTGRTQTPARWHWRAITVRTGDLRGDNPAHGLATAALKRGLFVWRTRRGPTAGAGGD